MKILSPEVDEENLYEHQAWHLLYEDGKRVFCELNNLENIEPDCITAKIPFKEPQSLSEFQENYKLALAQLIHEKKELESNLGCKLLCIANQSVMRPALYPGNMIIIFSFMRILK